MTKIATGYVALRAEVDDLKKDLAKAQGELERSTKTMQGQAVKTGKSFKAMWLAYAAGAAIVAAGAMKAIKAASDLQETASKFNVVFKGQTKLAETWSKALVDGFAMSTREAKHNLAAVQDLLVPMGMASDAAGKLSFEIVKLSADLGSFNNLPTEQVMLDIQSALVGNFETMKKYGVVLNATVVQQKAMEMGLAKTKGELDAGMKAQAAYALMVEGSAAAIGDMARTSDSFANVAKQAGAAWEDFMASLGELILPVATKVLSGLSSMVKGMNELIDTFKEGGTWIDKTDEWAAAAAAREGEGMADFFEVGGSQAATAGGGGGGGAAESAAIIDMKEVMREAKALREEDEIDLYSTLDAQEQYKQEMQDKDIARITERFELEREYREQKLTEVDEALQAEFELGARAEAATMARMQKFKRLEMKWDTTVAQHKMQTTKAWLNVAVTALKTFGSENKAATIAAIAIQTAFAAAVAFMSAKAAALRALAELGPIAGAPVAAAIEAYGALNVAAIVAMGAMQGAAVAVQGGGGGTVITPQGEAQVVSPAMGAPGEDEEQRGQVNIIIEGDVLADEYYIEMLAEKISEAVEGNEVRLIASETRAT